MKLKNESGSTELPMNNSAPGMLVPKVPQSVRISKGIDGAAFYFHPAGSTYKDPETKEIKVRPQAVLQYSKAGIPQKLPLGKSDVENFRKLLDSKQYQEIKGLLPDEVSLDSTTI